MQLTLLVLAAGMGSRYGGLKQVEPVGPGGATLLDYSVYDALRAGFGRIVFVIRRDFEAVFRERVCRKYAARVPVELVFQETSFLPADCAAVPDRQKPWGTGQAVLCARDAVRGPLAVINADDFYGRDSFEQLGVFLRQAVPGEAAMVGFRLANTLSEAGAVSRGICEVDAKGALKSVTERTGILSADVGRGKSLAADTLVSMNCWGFTPGIFSLLDHYFRFFLRDLTAERALQAEFYLPAAVSNGIAAGALKARVLPTSSRWFGVTYREDRPQVEKAIAELIRSGEYPENLWPE